MLYAPDGRREGRKEGREGDREGGNEGQMDRWVADEGWMDGRMEEGWMDKSLREAEGKCAPRGLGVSTQGQTRNPMRKGSLVPSLNDGTGSSPEPRPPDSILSNHPGTHPQASQGPERTSAPSSPPLLPGPTQA